MTTEKTNNHPPENPEDDYIGNMWGWKFSLFSLGLIILTMAVMWTRGEEAFEDVKKEQFFEIQNPHMKKDSI